ncbi:MAG: HNH endonuclease [Gallionella sp.]|nr:HNH endonuclease [Gallionella sp.]
MKTCRKCGSTAFYDNGGCKPCTRASSIKWREKNQERVRAYRANNREQITIQVAEYREKNKEKIAEQRRKYAIENRNKIILKDAKYRAANAGKRKAQAIVYRKNHTEKHRASSAAWAARNKEAVRIIHQNRRYRKKENGGTLSRGLIGKLIKLQNGKCLCCGVALGADFHLDHVMPLARGGAHNDKNMQLLCPTCNLNKHAKHPVDFMQERGFLL